MKKITSLFFSFVFALMSFTAALSVNDSFSVSAAKVYETPYYYNQMSEEAQDVYNTLKEAVLNCKKTVKIKCDIEQDDFDQIAELLILHDPMTFNLKDIEAQSATSRSITFKLHYRYSKENYDKMVASYKKSVDKVLAKLDDDMSTYVKIKTIHDAIANGTVYDKEYKLSDTIYGTLVKKKAKCDGYAKTFSYICGQAGIRTVTVIGSDIYTTDDTLHMWNKVYYNKKWYNVDVTWDDPVSNMTANRLYDFFMVSDKNFSKTHTEDNLSFKVPAATDNSKTYFKMYKKYAEDTASAKALLQSELEKAAKSGKKYVIIQCATDSAYKNMCKYILDVEKTCSMLKKAGKKNKNLVTELYSYGNNDEYRTIKLYLFYKNTDIDEYYIDDVDKDMAKALDYYRID